MNIASKVSYPRKYVLIFMQNCNSEILTEHVFDDEYGSSRVSYPRKYVLILMQNCKSDILTQHVLYDEYGNSRVSYVSKYINFHAKLQIRDFDSAQVF